MSASYTDIRRCLICAALSAALYAAMHYAMGLGFLSVVVTPVPVAFMAALSPLPLVLAFSGLGAGVVAAILGPMAGLEYFAQFALGGAVLGVGFRRSRSPEWMIGWFAAIGLLTFSGLVAITAIPEGLGPMEAIKALGSEWLIPLREAVVAEKLDPKQLLEAEEYLKTLEWSFLNIPFGIVTGFGVFAGWFNALTLRRFLTAKGEKFPSWSGWTAPEWWIWIPILAGLAGFFSTGGLRIVAMNVMVVAVVVYFLQGLAILESLFNSWALPGLARFFLMALVFLQLQLCGIVLVAFGAFDQWIDLRRRLAPKRSDDNV